MRWLRAPTTAKEAEEGKKRRRRRKKAHKWDEDKAIYVCVCFHKGASATERETPIIIYVCIRLPQPAVRHSYVAYAYPPPLCTIVHSNGGGPPLRRDQTKAKKQRDETKAPPKRSGHPKLVHSDAQKAQHTTLFAHEVFHIFELLHNNILKILLARVTRFFFFFNQVEVKGSKS